MVEQCRVVKITVRAHHEDIPRDITGRLDWAGNLPEFGASYHSAEDGSAGTSGDGGGSSGVGTSSRSQHIAQR